MNTPIHFIFYGNSTIAIGSGHIMRLFALAQWLQKCNFKITFVYKECLKNMAEKIQGEGMEAIQVPRPLSSEQIMKLNPTHLVIDDYFLSDQEWSMINKLPVFKIIFDDALNQNPLFADLVINSSTLVHLSDYKKRAPHAHFCLGSNFTLLRKEFVDIVPHLPNFNERTSILITIGGTDILGLTLPICTYFLKHYPYLPLNVLIGTIDSKQIKGLHELAKSYSSLQLHINPNSVAEFMASARLAISAAGGTLNELACMQTPTISLVCADNQATILNSKMSDLWYDIFDFRDFKSTENTVEDKKINDLCLYAHTLYYNKERRFKMHQLAQKAISVQGGQHLVDKIMSLSNAT